MKTPAVSTDLPDDPASTEPGQDKKAQMRDALRRRILSMEMKPGAVVDETQLAAEFGLSRPPVRELLRQMAAEGYLELEPNRAPRVSAMGYDALRSFFQAAPLVYVATSQLAAERATAADVATLREIQRRFQAAIAAGDIDMRVHWNDQFHLEIGKIASNAYLMPSLRRVLLDHARLGKIFYRPSPPADMQRDMATAVHQHDLIIDAIERRDTAGVSELVRAHMDLSRRRMAEYAAPAGLDVPLGG
jgi:DNA-binding GntR family transcriptional regulator